MKLPNWMRPYVGTIVGAVAATAASVVIQKVPYVGNYITPDKVAATASAWVLMNLFKTATNAKVNPTNSATGNLAASVPSSTVLKDSSAGKDVKANAGTI